MKNFDWSRFRNYGLWVSIAALIPMVLNLFGIKVIPEEYQTITNTILSILVAAGLLNNPTTTSKWFRDDCKITEEKEEG
ncbi:hypothetical protein JCM1393_01100 [Clostridium carnis]